MDIEFNAIKNHMVGDGKNPHVIYLDLYVKRVRLIVYSDEFIQHIESQIPYIISRDNSDRYDATVVLWKERYHIAPEVIQRYDSQTETYYYGVKNPEYEEFIKQGHFLVQTFFKILNTDHSSLVHAAAVGMNGEGALICARGQRGKSTLSVMAMFLGMEYVSDDYLLLEKSDDGRILASPIYSIITLSPLMTDKMKDKLCDAVLLGKNARKDKNVFNIACMHGAFRQHYPIKTLIFPEIVDCEKPFIRKATPLEKSRAVTQLLHSTAVQMNVERDTAGTLKLIGMVNQFDCYYFCLSRDIEQNAYLLKEFIEKKEY